MSSQPEVELRVHGRRLEAIDLSGDPSRPSLVLLHEGLGSVGLWRDFPGQLHQATACRVVAYSRYGHGGSEPPPKPRTPAFFEEEASRVLPSVLEQLSLTTPVLIGHSDGASIALLHAAAFDVTGLVLLSPHIFVEAMTLSAIRATRVQFVEGDLRARMARHHADPDAAFWGWCDVWLDPAFRDWSIEWTAERLACPVLLIQGLADPYGTLDQLDRIEARARGGVRRLEVPGGHSPHLDANELVVREVERFVDELPRGVSRATARGPAGSRAGRGRDRRSRRAW